MSFFPAFEAGAFLSQGCVLSLHCVPLHPWVVPPLLVSPSVWGHPRLYGGIRGHRRVVQPLGGISGVVLVLSILVLGRQVPPLEEWLVGTQLKVIESSQYIPLYRIYQLSQFGDIDHPVLQFVISGEHRWRQYSPQQVMGMFESFEEEIDSFIISDGVAR